MSEEMAKHILFVLEDDNDVMRAALDGDLGAKNKAMNRELIRKHERIIRKLHRGEALSQRDLQRIRDANTIHLNDRDNVAEHHPQAVKLNNWLSQQKELSVQEATAILEKHLNKNGHTPPIVYRALHTLWGAAMPADEGGSNAPAFDEHGCCLTCGSRVSPADVNDTAVLVGEHSAR